MMYKQQRLVLMSSTSSFWHVDIPSVMFRAKYAKIYTYSLANMKKSPLLSKTYIK